MGFIVNTSFQNAEGSSFGLNSVWIKDPWSGVGGMSSNLKKKRNIAGVLVATKTRNLRNTAHKHDRLNPTVWLLICNNLINVKHHFLCLSNRAVTNFKTVRNK